MKLKNKKTGEIGNLKPYGGDEKIWVWIDNKSKPEYRYNSLAELNEEWEDVPEEPKEHWTIGHDGAIFKLSEWENQKDHKEIGNYFETEEEAEKAVEKLEALKRLKDKGFRFTGLSNESIGYEIKELSGDFALDLDLLFNGGENG